MEAERSATEPSTAPGTESARKADHVRTLARGLAVIRAFNAERSELTLSEVAKETGLARAAARRFLLTLADLGYVRADGRRFALTPRVLELGLAYLSGLALPVVAQPHLEALVAEVGEPAAVAVLDGAEVVFVSRVATSRIMRAAVNVGTRFPAPATSMGRVLLAGVPPEELDERLEGTALEALTPHTVTDADRLRAEIDKARSQGWAFVDQELEMGMRAIAVPIRDAEGRMLAAMNLCTDSDGVTLESARRDLLGPMRIAAERIEADLAAAS
ncbi:IclR family transcriptional regulator C-terminal domain-containing protein [Glycomyces halotolerans]